MTAPGDRWLSGWPGRLFRLAVWALTIGACVAAFSCYGCAFAEAVGG